MRRRGRATPTRGVGFGTTGQPGRRRRVAYRYVTAGPLPNPRRTVQWWQFEPPRNVTDIAAVTGGGRAESVSFKAAFGVTLIVLPKVGLLPDPALYPSADLLGATGAGYVITLTSKGARGTVAATGGGRVQTTILARPRLSTVTVSGGGRPAVGHRRATSTVTVVTGGGTVFAPGSPKAWVRGNGTVVTITGRRSNTIVQAAAGGYVTVTALSPARSTTARVTGGGRGEVTAVAAVVVDRLTVTGGGRSQASVTRAAAGTASATGRGGVIVEWARNALDKTAIVTGGGTVTATAVEVVTAAVQVAGGGEITVQATQTVFSPLSPVLEHALIVTVPGENQAVGGGRRMEPEPVVAAELEPAL